VFPEIKNPVYHDFSFIGMAKSFILTEIFRNDGSVSGPFFWQLTTIF